MNGVAAMNENKWITPQVMFAVLGMLAAVAAAWMAFESRITVVEQSNKFLKEQVIQTDGKIDRIEDKLDRLIENRVGRGSQ